MTQQLDLTDPDIADIVEEIVDDMLDRMTDSSVNVETFRSDVGLGYQEPGMRDFSASLTLWVQFHDLDEDDLPDWYGAPSWDDVPHEEVMNLLAQVNPLLPVLALSAAPHEVEGALVRLVALEGSILNPFRMVGSTYDALDARSSAHEALFPAVDGDNDYGIGLNDDLESLVEGVGNVVLLTNLDSSPAWNLLSPGLEGGLLSLVLQDVADGSCAVVLHTGTMAEMTYPERTYLRDFLRSAAFEPWDNGIWYTGTAFQSFHDPGVAATELFAGRA